MTQTRQTNIAILFIHHIHQHQATLLRVGLSEKVERTYRLYNDVLPGPKEDRFIFLDFNQHNLGLNPDQQKHLAQFIRENPNDASIYPLVNALDQNDFQTASQIADAITNLTAREKDVAENEQLPIQI